MSLVAYLTAFAVDLWVSLHGVSPGPRRRAEIRAVVEDVATTDGATLDRLTLVNIAAEESGFERYALHPYQPSVGAFQIWVFPGTSMRQVDEWSARGAREALRRLRAQGIYGFMGCARITSKCEAMAERRTLPAKVYFWSHPFTPDAEPVAAR